MFPITIIDLVLWTVLAFLCRFYLHLENVGGIAFEGPFKTTRIRCGIFLTTIPHVQLKSDETAQLLNKPYVNEVTLRGQK